jgi:hypothetical protein
VQIEYLFPVPSDKATREERNVAGLCADCLYARHIESARGMTFYLCERSSNDPDFPKYPRIPVIECRGYEPPR